MLSFTRKNRVFVGFDWVSPSFTEFYRVVDHGEGNGLCFAGSNWVYRVLFGLTGLLPSFTMIFSFKLGYIEFYLVLPSFTEFYRVLPSFTDVYRVVDHGEGNGLCFAGSNWVYSTENAVHATHCTEMYLQCGLEDTRANMLLELTAQILREPCFNVLRTREQLGYIVFSGVRRMYGVQGLRFIVQSEKTPAFLDGRILAFLNTIEVLPIDFTVFSLECVPRPY